MSVAELASPPTLPSSPVLPFPIKSSSPSTQESTTVSEDINAEIMGTIETNSHFPYQFIGQPGMIYGPHCDPMMATSTYAYNNMYGFVPQPADLFQLQNNPLSLSLTTNPLFHQNEFSEMNNFPINQNNVDNLIKNPYSFDALLQGVEGPKDIKKILRIEQNQRKSLTNRKNLKQEKNSIPRKKAKRSYFQSDVSIAAFYSKSLQETLKDHKEELEQMQPSTTESLKK